MSNTINYAESFSQFLVQKYEAESRSYGLTQSNPQVQWIDAKTIKLPVIALTGYKDHTRTIGFNSGSLTNTWESKELKFDRDVEFFVDAMDVDETNMVASVANIQTVFEREQAIPETDAYRFSKLYSEFVAKGGTVNTTTLTVSNFLDWFDTAMCDMDDAGVPEEGRLLYLTPAMFKVAKNAQGLTRFINVNGMNDNSVNRKVWDLDDVEIIKVPSARMKTAYNFTTGFTPATGSGQINCIAVHPDSVVARERYSYIKMFAPGSDSRTGDGYIYQNRKYGDLFVLNQRLAGIAINAEAVGSGSNS
jgi:hypothetical protein